MPDDGPKPVLQLVEGIPWRGACRHRFEAAPNGRKRLAGDTARQANTGEVKDLRAEALALKELVADLSLENRLLKKNMTGAGGDHE